jgi:ferredoxin-nitrite reductase
MDNQAFDPEQQEYLKGFFAGVEARRGTLLPEMPAAGAPPDALRAAQDATIAAGGTLVAQEEVKREKHPLDRWDEITARAAAGKFPKPLEDFATRFHGLFYVGPTQDAFMCRLRIPGGVFSAHQADAVADIADELAGGFVDVTTRANLQLREISAANGPQVVMRLGEIGLLPRGTGADNVRNITASPTAGIDAAALIDTRPTVRALHHHILNTRDLFALPRKFNIAVNGGGRVQVLEETNDIALTAARLPDGAIVYRLGLGGITGHQDLARETGVVVAPEDVVAVCDAVLRVFIAHGDRTDRKKARLKYVLDVRGMGWFLAEIERVLGRPLTRAETLDFGVPAVRNAHLGIHPQSQDGLHYLGVLLPVGRVTSTRLRGLADIARRFGAGELRLTVWQNLLIPHIPTDRIAAACEALKTLGLDWETTNVRAGLVACTGAAGCKFAASHTKQHGAALVDFLEDRITVDGPLNIHLTGCHHSCAQHYIADIGLLGAKVDRGEDEQVEGYDLHVGGGAGAQAKIGRLILPKVAEDELGPRVLALLQAWQTQRTTSDESFQDFTARHDDAALRAMAETAA